MKDMSRADIAELSGERAVIMMLPCKNMQHMNGKTVPLVVGGGGAFIDAPAELLNLRRVDPVAAAEQSSTPLFQSRGPGHLAPWSRNTPLLSDGMRRPNILCGRDENVFSFPNPNLVPNQWLCGHFATCDWLVTIPRR